MKCIIIEDSVRQYHGTFTKKSALINPRNPYRRDEELIDYDMDSEDEIAEEQGEDLLQEENKKESDDENMEQDEEDEEKGFIVSDGHLSVCEYDFSQDGEAQDEQSKLAEI